jgi:hypothetical protein
MPLQVWVCSTCGQPWSAHLTAARRRLALDDSVYVAGKVRARDCVIVLLDAHRGKQGLPGPPGPTGAMGATGAPGIQGRPGAVSGGAWTGTPSPDLGRPFSNRNDL